MEGWYYVMCTWLARVFAVLVYGLYCLGYYSEMCGVHKRDSA